MEEFIKYIRSLEQRLADLEAGAKQSAEHIAELESRLADLETSTPSAPVHEEEPAAPVEEPTTPVEEAAAPVEEPAAPEMPELTFDFPTEEPEEDPSEEPIVEAPLEISDVEEEDLLTLDEEESLVVEDNLEDVEMLDGLEEPEESVEPEAPAAPVAPAAAPAVAAPAASAEDDVEAFRRKYASTASTRNESLFHTPVEDIGRAMSLGDQFFFRHELFSDNGELMAKTIQALNGAADINEATKYIIKNFGHQWEQIDHATVSRFMDVVQRRFI